MQPAGPLPDSEFSTGPWEVNGNGAPVLRARTRATSALMEFWERALFICCPGVCMINCSEAAN